MRPDGPPLVIGRYYWTGLQWLRLVAVCATGMATLEDGTMVRESYLRRCRSMASADPSPDGGKVTGMDRPRRLTTYQRTTLTNGTAAAAQAAAQYRIDGHPDLAAELYGLAEHARRVLALTEAASVQEPPAPRPSPSGAEVWVGDDDDGEVV